MTAVKYKNILIECVQGNIANQPDMDAIVNAANAQLLPGGGVAGAIHRAAGPRLEEACRRLAPIKPGQAVLTDAFNLPNLHVIHCLGPVYGRDNPSETLLADCYRNALRLADEHHLQSIAFPAISTGIFGYPMTEAARVAFLTLLDKAPTLSSINYIRFVLYNQSDQNLHAHMLEELVARRQEHAQLSLFTDLYELTMMQAYLVEGMYEEAVFNLTVRRLPGRRNFLVACGLATVLDYLENLRFDDSDLAYLASVTDFSDAFLDYLRNFRFTGNVYALPEGTPFFPDEPILEIEAPLPQAQLVETFIMNQVHLQTILATKAQRVVQAAQGRPVVDFGARRIHGIDAAVKAARAFYIGGVKATSNVLGGKHYGIPIAGTVAHAYIQAHENEAEAFRAFAHLYPKTMLVVDTYDTLAGVQKVLDLAQQLGEDFKISAIRLDSGDLLALSTTARRLLDQAGLQEVDIFVSGGLDEYKINRLLSAGAPINGFGVGTSMGVSDDVPHLDIGYKLCQYAGKGRLKLATDKLVLPGRKQVFRVSEEGQDKYDIIARIDEKLEGRPLLVPVMRNGIRLETSQVSLADSQTYAQEQINHLPERIRVLTRAEMPYPVSVSPELKNYRKQVIDQLKSG
jgi:nicotinate phosphoribosyltransferase